MPPSAKPRGCDRHRDFERGTGGTPALHPTLSNDVKLFVAVFDQAETGSQTAVVPGTWRASAEDPRPDFERSQLRWSPKAGDALLMNIHTWHGVLAPSAPAPFTPTERCGLIVQCAASNRKRVGSLTSSAERLAAAAEAGAISPLSPVARQLLGIEMLPELQHRPGGFDPPATLDPEPWAPADVPHPMLSPTASQEDCVARFRECGVVVIPGLVPALLLERLQHIFHQLKRAHPPSTASFFDLPRASLIEHEDPVICTNISGTWATWVAQMISDDDLR